MTDLFWPGAERAGSVFSQTAFLDNMIAVEQAWLAALVEAEVAPGLSTDLTGLLTDADLDPIARTAEANGVPSIGLLERLRPRLAERDAGAAEWLHRGLTSQDLIDTALMLCLRSAIAEIHLSLVEQTRSLSALAKQHRQTRMVGRTLTQHAVPITFGLKAATWLTGVLDAADACRLEFAVQVGGAAGTNAALIELCSAAAGDPLDRAEQVVAAFARRLGLAARPPWHTARGPVTRAGDALTAVVDSCAHIANDILVLVRPEIAEVALAGAGGSSTMPHKQNPVLPVLISRAALVAPGLAASLHQAAAAGTDERAAGGWQAEWATLRSLARLAVVAASQTAELLAGLQVDATAMQARAAAAAPQLLSEQTSIHRWRNSIGPANPEYLGASSRYIDATIARADRFFEGRAHSEGQL